MHTTNPGQITIITFSDIPTGVATGFQVINAATGLVAIARTETGVIERPLGSGTRVINFAAPAEGDLYLVVVDWSAGVLTPETSMVEELQVTVAVQPGSSGLGAVADYVKMRMGGETWKGLNGSSDYGPSFIVRAIEVVKSRVFKTPPSTADEVGLHILVLDYLGICAALELVPAARDLWGSAAISVTQGDDPTEVVAYPNRAKLMDDLRDDLLRKLAAAQAAALPYINDPVLRLATSGPDIDEDSDDRVTGDPRAFPTAEDFPGAGGYAVDAYGYAWSSGVRL